MLSRLLVMAGLSVAQIPPPEFDASIPDASVGQMGAETSQEMDDGKVNTVCAASRDCERGFSCYQGRCKYVGYRIASQPGCLGAEATLVFPLIVFWRWRRRRG